MTQSVLRRKGQLTLPSHVREALHIGEGDVVDFTVTDDGVLMRGLKTIPADQAWFWSDEWQAGEREASEQLERGEGTRFGTSDDFLDSLRRCRRSSGYRGSTRIGRA